MAEENKFRLPGSSYEELTKIIKGYGNYPDRAVVPDDIRKVTGIHPTNVSRNNAFLMSMGIIEGGKAKRITEKGIALAKALEFEMPDEIVDKWRQLVVENDFLQKILAAIRIRKGMDQSNLQSHIAYSTGQSKTSAVMVGANAIIDVLRAAALLRLEDGKLIVISEPPVGFSDERVTDVGGVRHETRAVEPRGPATVVQQDLNTVVASSTVGASLGTAEFPIGISIQIQIQCAAEEVEGLGSKLRALIDEVLNPSSKNAESSEAGEKQEEQKE